MNNLGLLHDERIRYRLLCRQAFAGLTPRIGQTYLHRCSAFNVFLEAISMRSAILSRLLILVSAVAHAAPLALGAVLDQNESSVTEPNTDRRYRSFAGEVEQALGQPVRLQYFKRGFSAIKKAKEGTLDLVFGSAHVVANLSNSKFEPIPKTRETTSA
jgi:hypothetical protein